MKRRTNPELLGFVRSAGYVLFSRWREFASSPKGTPGAALLPGDESSGEVPALETGPLPTVTVITRTQGRRPTALRRAMASVRAQKGPFVVEHLIVADGANISGIEELRRRGVGVRVVSLSQSGRSAAGNVGLREATGAFVLFLDDDDWLLPNCLATLLRVLINEESVSGVYSSYYKARVRSSGNVGFARSNVLPEFSRQQLLAGNFVAIQSVLFRRSCFERYGGFVESLEAFEDWELWIRYTVDAPFLAVPELLSVVTEPASIRAEVRARRFMATRWHLAQSVITASASGQVSSDHKASAARYSGHTDANE